MRAGVEVTQTTRQGEATQEGKWRKNQSWPLAQIESEIKKKKKSHHLWRNFMLTRAVHRLLNQEYECTPGEMNDIKLPEKYLKWVYLGHQKVLNKGLISIKKNQMLSNETGMNSMRINGNESLETVAIKDRTQNNSQ